MVGGDVEGRSAGGGGGGGGAAGGKGYCRQHVNVIFPDPISSVDSTTAAVRQATCAQQICHAKQQLFFSFIFSSFL